MEYDCQLQGDKIMSRQPPTCTEKNYAMLPFRIRKLRYGTLRRSVMSKIVPSHTYHLVTG